MEVCIPFFLDVDCLHACLDAVKRFVRPSHVLVNNASPERDITLIYQKLDLPVTVTSLTGTDHCEVLNYLFSKTVSDTVLILDQDCLLTQQIAPLLNRIAEGTVLLGPLDLFCPTGQHVKGQKIHNFVARLTPIPGYIHACFMLINARTVREKLGSTPFRYPLNVKPFGYGILGAEAYYGITYYCRKLNLPIEFMLMLPGNYGISAEIAYENQVYAIHLWYSSAVSANQADAYLDHVWMDGDDKNESGGWAMEGIVKVEWLQAERQRFLEDYWNNDLKIKWGLK